VVVPTPFDDDGSSDSATLQLTTSAEELLFYNAHDGTQIASNASVRDVDWATITCPLGWHVQGVWQQSSRSGADGSGSGGGGGGAGGGGASNRACLTVHRSHDRGLLAQVCHSVSWCVIVCRSVS